MKVSNHNTCVVYLLNDIDKHFHLLKIFLACLKINIKTLAKHRCGSLPTPTCDVTMHKMVVPYSSNVCENSLIQWNVWLHWLPRENVITMSPVLVGRNFSSVDILLTFTLCKCNVMTLLNNLSGTGPWSREIARASHFMRRGWGRLWYLSSKLRGNMATRTGIALDSNFDLHLVSKILIVKSQIC